MVFFSPIVETTWENINGEVSGIFVSVKKGIIPAADAFVPAAAFLQGFRGFVARTFSAWQKCRGGCRVMHGVFFIGKDVIVCTCPCLDGVMLADDAKLRHKMVAEQVVGAVFFSIFDAVEIADVDRAAVGVVCAGDILRAPQCGNEVSGIFFRREAVIRFRELGIAALCGEEADGLPTMTRDVAVA